MDNSNHSILDELGTSKSSLEGRFGRQLDAAEAVLTRPRDTSSGSVVDFVADYDSILFDARKIFVYLKNDIIVNISESCYEN